MHVQKKSITFNICLEKCKEGIVFLDPSERNLPIFAKSENIAKYLQVEVWLNIPDPKEKLRGYVV